MFSVDGVLHRLIFIILVKLCHFCKNIFREFPLRKHSKQRRMYNTNYKSGYEKKMTFDLFAMNLKSYDFWGNENFVGLFPIYCEDIEGIVIIDRLWKTYGGIKIREVRLLWKYKIIYWLKQTIEQQNNHVSFRKCSIRSKSIDNSDRDDKKYEVTMMNKKKKIHVRVYMQIVNNSRWLSKINKSIIPTNDKSHKRISKVKKDTHVTFIKIWCKTFVFIAKFIFVWFCCNGVKESDKQYRSTYLYQSCENKRHRLAYIKFVYGTLDVQYTYIVSSRLTLPWINWSIFAYFWDSINCSQDKHNEMQILKYSKEYLRLEISTNHVAHFTALSFSNWTLDHTIKKKPLEPSTHRNVKNIEKMRKLNE